MTTIVADKAVGFMAADRMITSNDGEFSMQCETKIQRLKVGGDRYLIGLAGLEGPCAIFMDWFENGDWDEPPEPMSELDEDDEFTVLLLSIRYGIQVVDKFMRMEPVDNRYYGTGTGGPAAWAILEAGCGVQKALETAIRLDPYSGFGYEVKYLDGTDELTLL